jgi:hypothetical protein
VFRSIGTSRAALDLLGVRPFLGMLCSKMNYALLDFRSTV